MPAHVRIQRPVRTVPAARRMPRAVFRAPVVARSTVPVRYQPPLPAPIPFLPAPSPEPNPYVEYGCSLTAEGGIQIRYLDLDLRLRHTLWRLLAWTVATGLEGWFVYNLSPVQSGLLNYLCVLACTLINWLIVSRPVEISRTIEIRPDCMILDGVDLFWRRYMENGWPRFEADEKGNQVLSGTYGTRFIEYLVVRHFDELDRAPEVLASHLQHAMQQLWVHQIL